MKTTGNFKYFVDGETKTAEELLKIDLSKMNSTVDGLNVHYSSPARSINKLFFDSIFESVDAYQKQNGGRVKDGGFPPEVEPLDVQEKIKGGYAPHYLYMLDEVGVFTNVAYENSKPKTTSVYERVQDTCKEDVLTNVKRGEKEMLELFKEPQKSTTWDKSGIKGQKFNKLKAPLDIVQTRQFPKALQLLSLATEYGHTKYKDTDSDYLNYKKVEGGSQTYLNAMARHSVDRNSLDSESGLHHFIHAVWNSLASLELWVEENNINIEKYSKDYLEKLK